VWSIQTASPPEPGSTQYQQIQNTSSSGGGGVRQIISGCVPGATYQISGWMRGNSAYATCRVRVSPAGSTDWATAVDLNPPAVYSGATWTPFSGTVTATGTNMTLWLDGQTTGTNYNKAACFDSITVSCVGVSVPPIITEPPTDQTVPVGDTATFTLTAVGSEPLSYRWQRNGQPLSDGGRVSGAGTPQLQITGVVTNDAGSYTCVVSNAHGSVTSSPAVLTVAEVASPLRLFAEFDGNSLRLSWPENPNARLERTTSLIPPVTWNVVTNVPAVGGGFKSLTLPVLGDAGYFRLVRE